MGQWVKLFPTACPKYITHLPNDPHLTLDPVVYSGPVHHVNMSKISGFNSDAKVTLKFVTMRFDTDYT